MNAQAKRDAFQTADHGGLRSDAESAPTEWFISLEKPAGPFDAQQVEKFLQSGKIQPSHWIWAPELGCWVQASEIIALMGRVRGATKSTRKARTTNGPQKAMYVFRSWRLVIAALAAFLITATYTYFKFQGRNGVAGLVLTLMAACWLITELRGVKLTQSSCSLPYRIFKVIPFIALFSRGTGAYQLCTLTSMKPLLGFERLVMEGHFGFVTLLFDSRDERNSFLDAIKRWSPNLGIYREA